METIAVVPQAGAENVVVADGLAVGQIIDGAPLLPIPRWRTHHTRMRSRCVAKHPRYGTKNSATSRVVPRSSLRNRSPEILL